jgi:hypothetical protein
MARPARGRETSERAATDVAEGADKSQREASVREASNRLIDMNAQHAMLHQLVDANLSLGAPVVHRGLTVFPLIGSDCPVEFISLDQALPLGFRVQELPQSDVNNLLAINPTQHAVLLLDGQEVLGAKQHRIFDGSFLVAPGARAIVSVCCIERGRWDGSRHREAFESASRFADPRVRAAQRSTRGMRADGTMRSDQSTVWKSIDGLMERTQTFSMTSSLADVQAAHADVEEDMTARFAPIEGQLGVLAYVGDELLGVELVPRAPVYRDVHEKLIRGFALVAAERVSETRSVGSERAAADLERLMSQPVRVESTNAGADRVRGADETQAQGQGLAQRGTLVHWSTIGAAA